MLRGIRDLSKSFHKNISIQLRGKFKKSGDSITYSYSDSLVSQRRKVENEWEKELNNEVEKEWKEPQMVTSLLSNVRVKKTYKY